MLKSYISDAKTIDRTPERAILRTATRRHNVFVSSCHMRHDVYRPRLHVRASQDKELQAPRKDMFDIPMMDSLEPFRLLCRSGKMALGVDSLINATSLPNVTFHGPKLCVLPFLAVFLTTPAPKPSSSCTMFETSV